MKCPGCDYKKLDVTHVYTAAGSNAESRDLKCRECGFKGSSVTFLLERPQEQKHGRGALALKRAIDKGVMGVKEA